MTNSQEKHSPNLKIDMVDDDLSSDDDLEIDIEATRVMRDEAVALRRKFDDFIVRLDTILYRRSRSKNSTDNNSNSNNDSSNHTDKSSEIGEQ